MTTDQIASAIHNNVDAFYADAIDHAEFRAQQTRLWDLAHSLGVSDAVAYAVSR